MNMIEFFPKTKFLLENEEKGSVDNFHSFDTFDAFKRHITKRNNQKAADCFLFEEKIYQYALEVSSLFRNENYFFFEGNNIKNALSLLDKKDPDLLMDTVIKANPYLSVIHANCNWDAYITGNQTTEYSIDNEYDKWNVILCPGMIGTGALKIKTFYSLSSESIFTDILCVDESFSGNDLLFTLTDDNPGLSDEKKLNLYEKINELLRFYLCSHLLIIE
ncbi:MAG: hypothetical protein FWF54_07680 [Candidatus Azobacteroides sp.]|nr:hypothetical protein [Candidatus Azobacteroides sp.]